MTFRARLHRHARPVRPGLSGWPGRRPYQLGSTRPRRVESDTHGHTFSLVGSISSFSVMKPLRHGSARRVSLPRHVVCVT